MWPWLAVDAAFSHGRVPDAPSLSQVLASGPTLRLLAVGPEDAGDYVCRAGPGLSGLRGGAAEARLTVNGEKAVLPSGPGMSWDKKWTEGARANGSGRGLEKGSLTDGWGPWIEAGPREGKPQRGSKFVKRLGLVGRG